ncbi:MAG: cell cycle transcriptional regulator TrcR [Alphaproteobacteria bacterium]
MTQLLMPKATAVWLVENTALTFDQIAAFTGLHALEVQAIADGQSAVGMKGWDPIANGQLTQAELDRCAGDPTTRLKMAKRDVPEPAARSKGPRYTPIAKRQDKPNAVAWLLRHHPQLTDAQVSKLIGTTKPTIQAIRDRSHWNIQNIKAQDPIQLGLCTQMELQAALDRAPRRAATEPEHLPGEGPQPVLDDDIDNQPALD